LQQKTLTTEQILAELKLVEAARADPQAFGVLYEKYYRQIFTFVYKRTGEEEVAGDLTSQVFLKAMLALPKFRFKGVPFSAWLYRIASNEVSQFHRETGRSRTISIDRPGMCRVQSLTEAKTEDPEEGKEEFLVILSETIDELNEEEVSLLELRYFEERPFAEVAFILGITENNAKVKTYRLLGRMKTRMISLKKGNRK